MVKRSKKNNKIKGGNPYIGELCREKSTLRGHSNGVTSVSFHPTEPILVTGSYDKTAKLWRFSPDDGVDLSPVSSLDGHIFGIMSVAFDPKGRFLATGSRDDHTTVWRLSTDGATATPVSTLEGHSGPVYSVAFHPTGRFLATGSFDKTARVWSMSPDNDTIWTCVSIFAEHNSTVLSVAFNPSGPYLATGSCDNTAQLLRLLPDGTVDPSNVSTLTGHNDWIRSVAFVPTTGLTWHNEWIRSVAFDPTGLFLATGCDDTTARVWRLLPDGTVHPSPIATLEGHSQEVLSVAFHPSGQFLVTGSFDNTVKLWRFPPDRLNPDRINLECIETLTGHTAPVTSVAFDPSGNLLATGSQDYTAKLWDCSKINVLLRIEALTRGSLSAKVIKDFTTGTSDQGLLFSNAAQGRLGNPPDTPVNRRKQDQITFKKYKGLPREPISSTSSDDFIQCDRCRANDVDAANWAALDPEYGVFFNQMSKSRCAECPGKATEADTDKIPGGGRSRKKLKKRLSRKLMIR